MPESECYLKHDIKEDEKQRKAEVSVCYYGVKHMSHLVCVGLFALFASRFLQSTMYDAVFGVHDCRLAVFFCLFQNIVYGFVSNLEDVVFVRKLFCHILYLLVFL